MAAQLATLSALLPLHLLEQFIDIPNKPQTAATVFFASTNSVQMLSTAKEDAGGRHGTLILDVLDSLLPLH